MARVPAAIVALALGGCVGRELDEADVVTCKEALDCADHEACFAGTCVTSGALRISLSWSVGSDFDLHVRAPSGVEIDFEHPKTAGAALDLDDCVHGRCRDPDGTHVENVVFFDEAPVGTYACWVENFDGRSTGPFVVEVAGATHAVFEGALGRAPDHLSEVFEFSVE